LSTDGCRISTSRNLLVLSGDAFRTIVEVSRSLFLPNWVDVR
jgi:hypothetical protein